MTVFRRISLLLLFLLLSPTTLWAQELYVSNKPFSGAVVKAGSGLQVELAPLLKALKMSQTPQGGQIKVGDKSIPVIVDASGKEMVSLPEFAAAANLVVRKNADFGYTDVYANTSAPAGDWGAEASGDTASTAGGGDKGYTIKVPSGYEMIDDPAMMDAIMGMAKKKSGSSLPEGMMRADFIVTPAKAGGRGGILMMMTMNLPSAMPAEAEGEFLRGLMQGMAQKGKVISGPTAQNIGGLKFQKALLKSPDNSMMESYFHIAAARGKVFWLALVDDEATYSTSFAPLRNAVESFRLK